MIEITTIIGYTIDKVNFKRIKDTFGYSQKLIMNTKLTYNW